MEAQNFDRGTKRRRDGADAGLTADDPEHDGLDDRIEVSENCSVLSAVQRNGNLCALQGNFGPSSGPFLKLKMIIDTRAAADVPPAARRLCALLQIMHKHAVFGISLRMQFEGFRSTAGWHVDYQNESMMKLKPDENDDMRCIETFDETATQMRFLPDSPSPMLTVRSQPGQVRMLGGFSRGNLKSMREVYGTDFQHCGTVAETD
eukprot:COSAG06_NODE_18401_length_889_cov_1.464557_1_plen_204_part_10